MSVRASVRGWAVALADATGLARNTVQARLAAFERDGVLTTFERRIDPAALGYSMSAYLNVAVTQRKRGAHRRHRRR